MVEKMNLERRRKPLHNFSMPTLKWGNQRFLKCMNVNSKGEIICSSYRSSSLSSDSDCKDLKLMKKKSFKPTIDVDDDDDGIEKFRAKFMIHLKSAADKVKIPNLDEKEEDESASPVVVASAVIKPWNLRTRRAAACKAPNHESSKLDERRKEQQNFSPQRTENTSPKSLRLRGLAAMAAANEEMEKTNKKEKERRKFSTSLARDEIKEDFFAMTGTNPVRKPKKRPRIIQKQLDNIFPGFWLTEITAESYRVPDEIVETKKN